MENNSKEKMDVVVSGKSGKKTIWQKLGQFFAESSVSIGRYMIGKFATSIIIGIAAYIVFRIIDIDLPWLLALILGLSNLIPGFGGWIGIILCAGIVVFFNPIYLVYTTITALILQLIEQFVLLPIIVGKAIDLKPMFIVVVLIAGSLLFGLWGIILAIPIAAIIKIGYNIFISKENRETDK